MIGIDDVDGMIAKDGAYAPRWGWHDDHAAADKTELYLPALQQVRAEFELLLAAVNEIPHKSAALQLGMGPCRASHDVWRAVFGHAVTIDFGGMWLDDRDPLPGANTHEAAGRVFAAANGPYDLLFIDAGHSEDDCALDHLDYGMLVRRGGIIAFHDALLRPGYEEVGVWRYLENLERGGAAVTVVGAEVGTAWVRKR